MTPGPDEPADELDALRAEIARLRSALDRAERRLAAIETRDRLTGLHDGRETVRLVRLELDRARRYGRPFSVVVVEVRDYAALVDRVGRQGADQALVRVARACLAGRRSVDVVGRLDAGEFAVVLPETPADGARRVAEHVGRTHSADTGPVELASGDRVTVAVRLAFGVVGWEPGAPGDADGLLAAARVAARRG